MPTLGAGDLPSIYDDITTTDELPDARRQKRRRCCRFASDRILRRSWQFSLGLRLRKFRGAWHKHLHDFFFEFIVGGPNENGDGDIAAAMGILSSGLGAKLSLSL